MSPEETDAQLRAIIAQDQQRAAERKAAEAERKAAEADVPVARYLTVGGATVDILDEHKTGRITVRCTACTWTDTRLLDNTIYDTPERNADHVAKALPECRTWAQRHAETCRAMPMPDGAR